MESILNINSIPAILLLTVLSALLLSIIIIPVVIRVAALKHLMDEPNERSSHKSRTPTLGGVSIFAATVIAYLFWSACCGTSILNFVMVSMIILFFVGLKDDIIILSPFKKMLTQIIAGLIIIIGANIRIDNLYGLFGVYEMNYAFSVFMTLWIYITILNAINLIDGIDGLAGGIGIIATLFFGAWFFLAERYEFAILAAALIGSLLGFLRFNFSEKRKIFMGDTGSLLVGFVLATLTIKFIQMNVFPIPGKEYLHVINAPTIAIAALSIPLFDTLRVFVIRVLNGKSPFYADKNHLHHLLLERNLSHMQSSCILWGINILAIVVTLAFFKESSTPISFLYLMIIFLIVLFSTDKGEFIGRNVL